MRNADNHYFDTVLEKLVVEQGIEKKYIQKVPQDWSIHVRFEQLTTTKKMFKLFMAINSYFLLGS